MATVTSEKSFAVETRYSNFYAGGDVAWSADGGHFYCLNGSEVCMVAVATGQIVRTYGTSAKTSEENTQKHDDADEDVDEDVIYSFALATNGAHLVSAHRSGLLRLWELETGKVSKLWKSQHKGPVVKLAFGADDKLICSSGADSTLRIWDFARSHCICVLREFTGPAQLLQFHVQAERKEIYAAGADNIVYCWNYESKQQVLALRGHLSQVTDLSFQTARASSETSDAEEQQMQIDPEAETQFLATVSRDKVLIIWNLADGSQHKVLPMFEELEAVHFLPEKRAKKQTKHLIVAASNGNLKMVDINKGKITALLEQAEHEVKYLLHCAATKQLAVVTVEHNILVYTWQQHNKQLSCIKQLIGFNDELLDMCYLGEADRFLTVATNSKTFKIYDTEAAMNCKIIAGHSDTVLTLSSVGNLLLTAGKDFSIMLWQMDADAFQLQLLAKNVNSHISAIGCISFAYNNANALATVSQDGSLKVWQLLQDKRSKEYNFKVKYAARAHEKDVNCVAYSPNNKLLATASQDKTVRLWSSEAHESLGVLRGHTRGVWSVRFSPVDQIALSASGDCSMRLWSLATLACLKRFEQEATVLRAEFIDNSKYIVSAGSDGLIKLWNIKTNACVQTLDEHGDRVWSLAISTRSQRQFYSGGADSKLIRWQDATEQVRSAVIAERQLELQQEQILQSLLHQQKQLEAADGAVDANSLKRAFVLALTLRKPKASYNILNKFVSARDYDGMESLFNKLNNDQRNTLVEHVKAWSTNSRHCRVANAVLQFIVTDLIAFPGQHRYNVRNMVEVLLPYVQRHFKRVSELNKDLAFLDFIVQSI